MSKHSAPCANTWIQDSDSQIICHQKSQLTPLYLPQLCNVWHFQSCHLLNRKRYCQSDPSLLSSVPGSLDNLTMLFTECFRTGHEKISYPPLLPLCKRTGGLCL